MKKGIHTLAVALAILLLIFLSLDIRKLDSHKSSNTGESFQADQYTADFWENKLPDCIAHAVDLSELKRLIHENPEEAYSKYGHTLGISHTYYFYVKGKGIIESIGEEEILIGMDNQTKAGLMTLYIFGNAVRDGSGVVDINTFLNMMDFNRISVLLNKKVKSEVVNPALAKAKAGMLTEFTGAVEISTESFNPDYWQVIPLQIKFQDGNQ